MGNKSSHYELLKSKWSKRHDSLKKNLWDKHKESLDWFSLKTKQLGITGAAGLMLLSPPQLPTLPLPHMMLPAKEKVAQNLDKNVFLISDLFSVLPNEVRPLSTNEEEKIAEILTRNFGFKVSAELNGIRLNRSYGLIGAEQHLARYQGDTMSTHFDTDEEARLYYSSGMAPGLGAWGYFAKSQMTEQDKLREKYYIAVQTFLSPGFHEKARELINFFKYRKMLVVNPNNGKTIVAIIGDAGPATWTGKSLGGSPEVMKHLERVDGSKKGPVLYFFIDDPQDQIPLGPIDVVK